MRPTLQERRSDASGYPRIARRRSCECNLWGSEPFAAAAGWIVVRNSETSAAASGGAVALTLAAAAIDAHRT